MPTGDDHERIRWTSMDFTQMSRRLNKITLRHKLVSFCRYAHSVVEGRSYAQMSREQARQLLVTALQRADAYGYANIVRTYRGVQIPIARVDDVVRRQRTPQSTAPSNREVVDGTQTGRIVSGGVAGSLTEHEREDYWRAFQGFHLAQWRSWCNWTRTQAVWLYAAEFLGRVMTDPGLTAVVNVAEVPNLLRDYLHPKLNSGAAFNRVTAIRQAVANYLMQPPAPKHGPKVPGMRVIRFRHEEPKPDPKEELELTKEPEVTIEDLLGMISDE